MLTIPTSWQKIISMVFQRTMIYVFVFLTLEFSRLFISASAKNHPYLAMWCDIFFEATTILIFALLFGRSSVGRDANTLNSYALLIHLAYIPCYFYGLQVASLHNNAVQIINLAITLRLFYIGEKEFFSRISAIEIAKDWLLNHKPVTTSYLNRLTIALFILCAAPLFTLIYLINNDRMTATGIAIVLFTFFIATGNKDDAQAEQARARALAEKKSYLAKYLIRVGMLRQLRGICRSLAAALALMIVIIPVVVEAKGKAMYHLGYASGYADGKTGAAPKSETSWKELVRCYDLNGGDGRPRPPDPTCKKLHEDTPQDK